MPGLMESLKTERIHPGEYLPLKLILFSRLLMKERSCRKSRSSAWVVGWIQCSGSGASEGGFSSAREA